jgi:hypothetical protein
MSVVPNEVILYGSVDMPEADGVTVGGAVDLTKRVAFYDISTAGTFDIVSSSASDTATKVQVTGRDSSGTIQTPAASTLNGTTVVANAFGAQSFERLIAGVITGGSIASLSNPGGTTAVGDVAILSHTREITGHTAQAGSSSKSGTTPPLFKLAAGDGATLGALTYAGLGLVLRITGGTGVGQLRMISAQYAFGMLFEIAPNPVLAITRLFATAQADVPGGASRVFYEKIFALNTNTVTALTTAALEVLSETPALPGAALLDLALCKALNDTATAANRQTLPVNGDASALTFVTQPSLISVIASPGSLPNGNSAAQAQGMWLRLTLPAGTTVFKGAADVRINGTTA